MKRTERGRIRRRVDLLLVERGLASSREKAQAFVLAGLVSADGRPVAKAGALIPEDADLHVTPTRRFVSRGGDKLDGALTSLDLDVTGIEALDVGASTGGFTDCLLQRGAKHVVALDVGRGQLDWSLRNDARVSVVEGVNARYLDGEHPLASARFDLIVVDVSFISLGLVIPVLVPLLRERALELAPQTAPVESLDRASRAAQPAPAGAPSEGLPRASSASHALPPARSPLPAVLALVKPQFELGRGSVGRGGIVREPAKHLEAILKVVADIAADRAASAGDHVPPAGGRARVSSDRSRSRSNPHVRVSRHSDDLEHQARTRSDDSAGPARSSDGQALPEAGTKSDQGPTPHPLRLGVWAIVESPIRGAEGNREFFVHLVPAYVRSAHSIEEEARRVAGVSVDEHP